MFASRFPSVYHGHMEEKRQLWVTKEYSQNHPVLIIDKKGTLGEVLVKKLCKEFLVIFVTEKEVEITKNIIHISYKNKLPEIPNNSFSHMFVFYSEEREILAYLPSFIHKASQIHSLVFFLTASRTIEEKQVKRFLEHPYVGFHLFLYGDLFSSKELLENRVSHLLHQAKTYGTITLDNDGLRKLYPVSVEDTVSALITAVFAQSLKERLLLIFHPQGVTELSFARALQQINPLLKLNFRKQKKNEQPHLFISQPALFHAYDLESALRSTLKETSHTVVSDYKRIKKTKKYRGNAFSFLSFFLVFVGGFLVVPLTFIFLFMGIGNVALYGAFSQLQKGQSVESVRSAMIATTSFQLAERVTDSFFVLTFFPQQMHELRETTQIGETLSDISLALGDAVGRITNMVKGEGKKQDIIVVQEEITSVLLKAQWLTIQEYTPSQVTRYLVRFVNQRMLAEQVGSALPVLFGINGNKKYLVLFQNNKELRPGGGFIGSYARVDSVNGIFGELKVYDVYDADGKLKEEIAPAYGLKRYLGTTHLFLRDSNFDVDFPTNALLASFLFQKEMNERVDGVIALDTEFFKQILSALGQVYVPEYNVTVTPKTFYLLTQNYAEKNFFPGSTQKKNFLQALMTALLMKISQRDNVSLEKLSNALFISLKEKHLLVSFFDDSTLQSMVTVSGLSGSLWDGRVGIGNMFLDTLGIYDANIGLNKVNTYVTRSLSQHVVINGNGGSDETTTVTYTNNATNTSPYGGDYKNYVRYVLPLRSVITRVTVNGVVQNILPAMQDMIGRMSVSGVEVETTEEKEKKIVGFFVIVPKGQTVVVALSYSVGNALSVNTKRMGYSLFLLKQPGGTNDSYSLTVTLPSTNWKMNGPSSFVKTADGVQFSGILSQDSVLTTDFLQE